MTVTLDIALAGAAFAGGLAAPASTPLPPYLAWVVPILVGYLLGAIPFGLIVGKLTKGLDIRQYGSGKVGATNTLRTLGWGPSVVVFLADVGKAAAAVGIAGLLGAPPAAQSLAGVAAVVGHCWSAYIAFGGGRGVSSSLGAGLAIAPPVGLFGLLCFGAAVASTRYVSLGSLIGTSLGTLSLLALIAVGRIDPAYWPLALASLVVIYRHADNIARLRAGTERKLGQKAESLASDPRGGPADAGGRRPT